MNLNVWQQRFLVGAVGFLALLVVAANLISSSRWVNQPFPGFFLYDNLAVSPDFLPQWSGKQRGMRFLDRVVGVEGRRVERAQEVYDLVRSRPPKTLFRYTVERDSRRLTLTIPSMKFLLQDWLLTYGIYLLIGITFLAIGVTPLWLRSNSPSAVPLFFMVSVAFLWFATTFDFMATQILPKEIRAFAFALTPSAGIHLGLSFSRGLGGRKGRRVSLLGVYVISVLLGLSYSSVFYAAPDLWQWILKGTYVYSCLAALVFLGLLSFGLRQPGSDLERSRLRVMLVGAILGFFIPTLGTVLASSFDWEIPHNVLLIAAVFFPLSVAYALLKYDLFDIDALLKAGLTGGALTAVLFLIYVVVVALLSFSVGIYERNLWAPLFFSFLVALVFNRLLRSVEGVVGRYVYHRDYDPMQLQSEVSSVLRSLSRPQTISEKYLKTIADRIGIERAFLFCRSEEQGRYITVSHNGNGHGAELFPTDLNSPWMVYFGVRRKGISKDEVESDPLYRESHPELLRVFREFKLELLIPMIFEEEFLGFVSLGRKRSGRGYSADDFKLLSILADQLSLSIKNGMLFEESEKAKENNLRLYNRSESMNRRLVEMDQRKRQFVANISHELRTPISTILGYTEVLQDPGFSGETRLILQHIVTNGRDLSQLMDSLLDFSTMEAGAMSTTLHEIDVRELFQSLEAMTRRLLKEGSIRFGSRMDSPMDRIRTDGKKLQHILIHLLTNAVKFTERGEITLEIKSVPEKAHEFVEFSVSDTGIGISREDQEAIFEDFHQLDGSSTRQYGGTGVGLSLCKKLAQSIGGSIEVQSEPGRGSTFSLILPVRRSVEMSAASQGAL